MSFIWQPLERLVGTDRLAEFLYVGKSDDGLVLIFRHTGSQRSIYIGLDGQTYRYEGGSYLPIPATEALRHVFGNGGQA